MSYFKTSLATLQALAKHGRHEDVAGFLVLARHASGLSHAGFEPYKLSGAGVNSVHEKAGLSEEVARGVIQRLQQQGVIRPTSPETKRAFGHARWEIVQGPLDLALPHALVALPKGVGADSMLQRLKKHRIAAPAFSEALKAISDTELRLDALMLLVSLYAQTSMCTHGGVSPRCIYRPWQALSRGAKMGSVRWGAQPGKTDEVYTHFMASSLRHIATDKKGEPSPVHKTRFYNAWHTIKDTGLVYEAVSYYDASPEQTANARLVCTLRINDWHAGHVGKAGDPSLLRTLEEKFSSHFAYYNQGGAQYDQPDEALRVHLPTDRGALVGVWRLRFRPHTPDVGAWLAQEAKAIAAIAQHVEAAETEEKALEMEPDKRVLAQSYRALRPHLRPHFVPA